jgi:hypothetical protein
LRWHFAALDTWGEGKMACFKILHIKDTKVPDLQTGGLTYLPPLPSTNTGELLIDITEQMNLLFFSERCGFLFS